MPKGATHVLQREGQGIPSWKKSPAVERLLYRPREAAEGLGVSRSQVYELMNREIPWVVLGSVRVCPWSLCGS